MTMRDRARGRRSFINFQQLRSTAARVSPLLTHARGQWLSDRLPEEAIHVVQAAPLALEAAAAGATPNLTIDGSAAGTMTT